MPNHSESPTPIQCRRIANVIPCSAISVSKRSIVGRASRSHVPRHTHTLPCSCASSRAFIETLQLGFPRWVPLMFDQKI